MENMKREHKPLKSYTTVANSETLRSEEEDILLYYLDEMTKRLDDVIT